MQWRRCQRTVVAAAMVVVVASTGAACTDGGREGTIVSMTAPLPTVSCSAGLGGEISITNIPSALLSARIGWTFNEPADPEDFIGFVDPFKPATPPPASVTLSAPPWSSSATSALLAPSVTVLFAAKDGTFGAKTYSCSKLSDSPSLAISCSHVGPGTIHDRGTVSIHSNDLAALGSEAVQVRASWWWTAIPVWQAVLSPWLATIPESWTSVEFAETTYHSLPGTTSTAHPESKEFSSTEDLDLPDAYAGGYISHVRVDAINDSGRAVSYPAQAGC